MLFSVGSVYCVQLSPISRALIFYTAFPRNWILMVRSRGAIITFDESTGMPARIVFVKEPLERLEHCGTWRGTYYHAGTIPETPEKPKRFYFRSHTGCVTFGFSIEEWRRLKSLFTAALATPHLQKFFSELSLIYGEL